MSALVNLTWVGWEHLSDPPNLSSSVMATGRLPIDPQKMMLGPCRGGAFVSSIRAMC